MKWLIFTIVLALLALVGTAGWIYDLRYLREAIASVEKSMERVNEITEQTRGRASVSEWTEKAHADAMRSLRSSLEERSSRYRDQAVFAVVVVVLYAGAFFSFTRYRRSRMNPADPATTR